MRKEFIVGIAGVVIGILGVGVTMLLFLLPYKVKTMTDLEINIGFAVAGLFIIGGVLTAIFAFTSLGGKLMNWVRGFEFRFPVTRKSGNRAQLISEAHEPVGEVSEHIIKHIQSVTEQLGKVTLRAHSCSLKQIFSDILADNAFSAWCQGKPSSIQLTRLFDQQLDQLFDRLTKYTEKTRGFGVGDVAGTYNEIKVLNFYYRSTVSEFIQLLSNLGKEGAPIVWDNEPLSGKIYRDLRDNYDDLMQRIKNLKVYVPDEAKSLLPSDDQLTKFDRIPGLLDLMVPRRHQ